MKNKTLMKILSAFLAVAIVLCSAPLSGLVGLRFPEFEMPEWLSVESSASGFTEGIFTYTVSANSATIISCDKEASGDIVIPDTLGGYPVRNISGKSFSGCKNITSVKIPETVTYIGMEAFNNCSNLISVSLPEALSFIGDQAFMYCTSLVSIIIPDNTSFGTSVFSGCTSLSEVVLPEKMTYIVSGMFNNCSSLKNIVIPDNVQRISYHAFLGCSSLENITIPDGVTEIEYAAFKDCTLLSEINIPDSVTEIENETFYNCKSLTNITIPDTVTSIGASAFRSCESLTTIEFPENINVINDYTFFGCTSLASVTIPSKVTSIGFSAFCSCKSLTSIVIPDSVTTIESYAFKYCEGLISINIPDSVTSIGSEAFGSCINLTSITIPDSVSSLGNNTFTSCTNLGTVTIGSGIENLPNGMFNLCSNLTSVTFSEGVKSLGNNVFYRCKKLASISLPDSIVSIGNNTFYECTGLTSVKLPENLTNMGNSTFQGCSNLISVEFGNNLISMGNETFKNCKKLPSVVLPDSLTSVGESTFDNCYALDTITFSKNLTTMGGFSFYNCSSLVSVDLPDSLTSLGGNAFSGCKNLTTVKLPKNLTELSKSTFSGCVSLVSVELPESLTVLCDYVFKECGLLSKIELPDSVTTIGNNVFEKCESLTEVKFGKSVESIGNSAFNGCVMLSDVTIPDSVISIGDSAFYECEGIKKLTLGSGIESIGNLAFRNCSSLTDVYFNGTEAEWNEVIIGYSNDHLVLAEFHFVDDTTEDDTTEDDTPDNIDSSDKEYYTYEYIVTGDYTSKLTGYLDDKASVKVPAFINQYEVKEIADTAFADNKNIETITITYHTTSIADNAFSGCDNLTKVRYNGTQEQWDSINFGTGNENLTNATLEFINNTEIEDKFEYEKVDDTSVKIVYYDGDDVNLIVPAVIDGFKVVSIGEEVFKNGTFITARISEGIETVGISAFENCEKLTIVKLPDSLIEIAESAFKECDKLFEIALPDSVNHVGENAFNNCESLVEVVLPEGLETIEKSTFEGCLGLKTIHIPASVTVIGANAFYKCVNIEKTYFGGTNIGWKKVALNVGNDNITDSTISYYFTCSIQKDNTIEVTLYGGVDTDVVVPDYLDGYKVTKLRNSTFSKNTLIERVVITGNVKTIEVGAMTTNSFYNCTSLKEVVFNRGVIEIGAYVFKGCTSLEKVTIPRSVTKIGEYVFDDTSKLTDVYYGGNEADWDLIQIDSGNGYLNKATIHFTETTEGIFEYSVIDENSVEIIGYIGDETTIMVPSTIDGYSVVSIGEAAFKDNKDLMVLRLPTSVQKVEESAFEGCSELKFVYYDGTELQWKNLVVSDGNDPLISAKIYYYFKYSKSSSNTVTITQYNGLDTDVIIPAYLDGYAVTALTSSLFANNSKITSVTMLGNVEKIGVDAFRNCTNLTDITLPGSLKSIATHCFVGCGKLVNVNYTGDIASWCNIDFEYYSNPIIIAKNFMINGVVQKDIVVPDSVSYIKKNVFSSDCFDSVTISENVTRLGANVVKGKVYYTGDLASWCNITFEGAFGASLGHYIDGELLTEVIIPDSVKEIKQYTFADFDHIETVVIHDFVTVIGAHAFDDCDGLKDVVVGNGVKTIDLEAFESCGLLENVVLGDGLISIGSAAFRFCSEIKNVEFGKNIETIGSGAFYGCYNLKNVILHDGLVNIESSAFSGCYDLESVTLPESLKTIGILAFSNCKKLTDVSIPQNVTSIGSSAFSNCPCSAEMVIPSSVTSIGDKAFLDCTKIERFIVDENNEYYSSDEFGVLYNKDKTVLIQYPIGNTSDYFEIPSTVKTIYKYAFAEATNLVSVKISASVNTISGYAFRGCTKLNNVVIPDSVNSIGEYAFSGCKAIKVVSVSDSVKTIGKGAFYNCVEIVTMVIPDGTETIADEAFENCQSLKTVIINDSVTSIGADVFNGCKNLSDIHFRGIKEEWENIAISATNEELFNATIHYLYYLLIDDDTDVRIEYEEGEYEDGTDIDAVKIPDDGQIMLTNDQKKKTNAVIYDIATIKDNMKVQPNGKVKVMIPAPPGYKNSKIFVFHIDNTINGREWIPARIIDGYVVFEVTHFSLYAVADLDFTFSLDKSTATVTNKNKTVQLSPVIESEIAINGYTVQWTSSNEKVAKVDENGLVTRVGNGECTITATFNEDEAKVAVCTITSSEEEGFIRNLKLLRGTASMKSYKGEDYVAITMVADKTATGVYTTMTDGSTVEITDTYGTIQDLGDRYVAYQSQNKTNPVATMKVTYADGTVETYPVVFELYEMEREIPFNATEKIKPIRGSVSMAEDAKGEYILVEMNNGQSSVGVYKSTTDGSTTATLDGAEGMFTEQEKLYIFYGSQNTFNPEGRLTVTEADGSQKTYRIVFKMYEMDPYVNVAKGLRPVRGAVTFDADGTIRIKMTSGQRSVGLYKTMANGATFKVVDANGRITNNPSSIMFYMSANTANVTATMIFTLPDGTTKEQKIIFDMGLASDPDPLLFLTPVRGAVSYQNDGVEDYIEVKANALSSGVGLNKDCLVKYTITDVEGIMTENDSRYYIYKSQNPDGVTANINFLQSDGSYKTYKVKFVF